MNTLTTTYTEEGAEGFLFLIPRRRTISTRGGQESARESLLGAMRRGLLTAMHQRIASGAPTVLVPHPHERNPVGSLVATKVVKREKDFTLVEGKDGELFAVFS